MKTIDQFLLEIPVIKIPEILSNYEELRAKGSIGDCPLREYTEDYISQNEIDQSSTVLWLDRLGMETYRFAALVLMGKA